MNKQLSPQCATIFDHLLRGGTLTAGEAFAQPFGTTCLAKRISEIEKTGIVIDKDWETNGKKRWLRYSYHKSMTAIADEDGITGYVYNEVRI